MGDQFVLQIIFIFKVQVESSLGQTCFLDDIGDGGLAESEFRLDTEKLLCSSDKGAVKREADVTCLKQLDYFIFFTVIFKSQLVLVIESGFGVLVDVEIDFIANLSHDVQLNVFVEIEIVLVLLTFTHGRVTTISMLETECEVDGTLWADVNGVGAEDHVEGFAADIDGRDDGGAVGCRT